MVIRVFLALLCCLLLVSPAWAADFTEDFDCANNAALNCDLTWTELVGTDWQIISNAGVISGNTNFDQAFPTSLMTTDSQYVEGVLRFAPNGTNTLSTLLDCQRSATVDTRYSVVALAAGAVLSYTIDKSVAGRANALASSTQDPVENDVVRLECRAEGANMRLIVYVNTIELFNVVDSSSPITGNVRMGISAFSNGAGQVGGWKSLAYGDLPVTTKKSGMRGMPR